MTRPPSDKNLTVAVLGPLGTYTHEAAYQQFGPSVEYLEKTTIKDVFDALSSNADLSVVPQENSIFGSVIETYDVLRGADPGFVRGEVMLRIQHCLLTRQGVKLHDIQTVMSHEQALGQCQRFLKSHLPLATLVKTSSTAAAAKTVVDSPANCAAIASKICVTLFDGLTVQYEGIQNEASNFTRFFIVVKDRKASFPSLLVTELRHALIQVSTQTLPGTGADISQLISSLNLRVVRLDRRPAVTNVPFHDIYLVEVQDAERYKSVLEWTSEVDGAISRIGVLGGNAKLIGLW
ncbi:Prephenate dehydratase-domain-containing protein [Collybia nuda]|uniref:prephenate dehydratase n=1 Tax=Collybia nuda TaxID=64659 RepID=A0A9P5Y1V7_9AGAR|nr:Prephenate dehydratase-domain-containing protein [Collybia nuda]